MEWSDQRSWANNDPQPSLGKNYIDFYASEKGGNE